MTKVVEFLFRSFLGNIEYNIYIIINRGSSRA